MMGIEPVLCCDCEAFEFCWCWPLNDEELEEKPEREGLSRRWLWFVSLGLLPRNDLGVVGELLSSSESSSIRFEGSKKGNDV